MLLQRVATAAVGIPIIVLAIWFGSPWLTALVCVVVAVGVLEIHAARGPFLRPLPLIAAGLALLLPLAADLEGPWLLRALTALVLVPTAALALTRDPGRSVEQWLWLVAPALYLAWFATFFVLLRDLPDGREWLLLVVLTVWITDTGAYFVGRAVGRRKLAPAVSPGKTWEGAIGGQVTGLVAVVGLVQAFGLDVDIGHAVALGLIAPFAAQVGDLAESALKRGLGVKDSSQLVPGHGGIVDRLDSLLFAAPAVYWYVQWVII
jgi:phosphatidate cytidylyltransferase